MNKEKARQELDAAETEVMKLRDVFNASMERITDSLKGMRILFDASDEVVDQKPAAREWLLDFLSKPFEVKLTQGYITYYRDGQWLFQQDFQNGILWCYYYDVWKVLGTEYNMKGFEIKSLIKDVVGKALDCEGLTPRYVKNYTHTMVGKALDCEGFTPK